MVPSFFQFTDDFPLTPHGKVDRTKLVETFPPTARRSTGSAFHSETEATLAVIWSEAMEIPDVGANENFYDLGGDFSPQV